MKPFPRIEPCSDRSLLVVFDQEISIAAHRSVLRLTRLLLERRDPFIVNLHPGYSSVLVSFDPAGIACSDLTHLLETCLGSLAEIALPKARTVLVPVCYEGDLAPDLADIAALHGLEPAEVVRIHCAGEYRVHFLGFSPGFPYMGGLSERIATPRLATPRTRVPAGSVAIAGLQTGIYPMSSPGGWRILGRTPLRLFRPEASPPVGIEMGDIVRFRRIARDEFDRLLAGESAH